MTVLYSILHLLVDGVCAMAMFGKFIPQEDGYFYILLYNFCAFALQMPFGVVLDALNAKTGKPKLDFAFLTVVTGVLCTMIGALTHPVVLGIGNALFHVGGGVGTIREDHVKDRHGIYLGIFVAPGALGLYFGTLIAQMTRWKLWFLGTGVIMLLVLCVGIWYLRGSFQEADEAAGETMTERKHGEHCLSLSEKGKLTLALGCFLVVILRSYIGMAVVFSWKTGVWAGMLSVFALAGGKMMGGFLAAWKGAMRTTVVSLSLAAFCYLFSSVNLMGMGLPIGMGLPMGLAALVFFNMTMPITLYWMVCDFPQMPGFAFGFLTFALFLGFLPGYFGLQPIVGGNIIGSMGSVLSLLLLVLTHYLRRRSCLT